MQNIYTRITLFLDGPTLVSIEGPPQPFDTNGSTPFNLTCVHDDDVSPSTPTYMWRRLPDNTLPSNEATLSLTATRDLDGASIQCTARNQQFPNDVYSTADFELNLHCKLLIV
jgi:hypothetical protein